MKKVFGVVRRTAQKFNIDNRAQRVIEKEKPTPAPRHDARLDSAKLHQVEKGKLILPVRFYSCDTSTSNVTNSSLGSLVVNVLVLVP